MNHDPNTPEYYHLPGGKDVIDVITDEYGLEAGFWFCVGNVRKYMARAGKKDDLSKDVGKALHYVGIAQGLLDNAGPHDRMKDFERYLGYEAIQIVDYFHTHWDDEAVPESEPKYTNKLQEQVAVFVDENRSTLPTWAAWAAATHEGTIWAFKECPLEHSMYSGWEHVSGETLSVGKVKMELGVDLSDWRDSIVAL